MPTITQLIWGESLTESINKMAAYVSSQPNWFDKRFTLVRSDSGFSSNGVETENQLESPREALLGFNDVGDISVVLGNWLSGDISMALGEINKEYEQQVSGDYVSVSASVLDEGSIGEPGMQG